MAFFGDFKKIFLGGSTTADVGASIGQVFGAPEVGRIIGKGASDFTSRAGDVLDISERPAGVDSPATVSQVSQTSQVTRPTISPSAQGFGMQPVPQQAFIGGLAPLVGQGLGQAARLWNGNWSIYLWRAGC